MTLDEAIKHCEEVAEKYCEAVEEGLTADDFCDSCESDHRQLAEWLRELKQLREQESILDKIRAEIEELDGKYVIGDYGIYGENIPKYIRLYDALDIIDKYKAESEDKV